MPQWGVPSDWTELLGPKVVQPVKSPVSNPELVRMLAACICPANKRAANAAHPRTAPGGKNVFEIPTRTLSKVISCVVKRMIISVQARRYLVNLDRYKD